jgi:hypothetical protein
LFSPWEQRSCWRSRPGTASADCSGGSDTCTPGEIRYLQVLQADNIDVSGGTAATAVQVGQTVCADLRAGADRASEADKVWASQSGSLTKGQAFMTVFAAATYLCPGAR